MWGLDRGLCLGCRGLILVLELLGWLYLLLLGVGRRGGLGKDWKREERWCRGGRGGCRECFCSRLSRECCFVGRCGSFLGEVVVEVVVVRLVLVGVVVKL